MDNKERIAILIPTKARANRLLATIWSCHATANYPELIEYICYVDHDDDSYNDLNMKNIKIVKGPKIWLSGMYNALTTHTEAEILMYGSDDIKFKSKNWDEKIRESLNNFDQKFGLVFPNDLSSHNGKIATHGFVNRIWLDTLGFLLPPYFVDTHTDLWITELARKLNRLTYLDDVVIEHEQYRQGKSNFDSTYKDRIRSTKIQKSHKTYKKLKREFWIQLILSAHKLNIDYPRNINYLLGYLLSILNQKNNETMKLKYLTTSNLEFLTIVLRKVFRN